jgi:1-acyl-sn-glycerol-3-phosphate acyltransferase
MSTFEEELWKVQPTLQRWISFLLLGKKIEIRGASRFIREGPSLIVGNHCGAFKDIGVVIRSVPRPVFFTANRQIFTREDFDALIRKHLVRHLGDFGIALNALLKPLKGALIRFVTKNIGKVGTIPVDLKEGREDTRRQIQRYLEQGRAVIALQGRGRVQVRDPHPYVSQFRPGTAAIAHNLYLETGISVPVTPLAIYGSQKPWLVPGTIKVNVGEPLFIRDHMGAAANDVVERFRSALEVKVKALFLELLKD